jgi:tetratricopeptide (TPR) repeat protein
VSLPQYPVELALPRYPVELALPRLPRYAVEFPVESRYGVFAERGDVELRKPVLFPLLPPLAAVLLIVGCATTKIPLPPPPPPREQSAAALAKAISLVESATIQSLIVASKALEKNGPGDAGSTPLAPAVSAAAAEIFAFLYPELPSPWAGASAAGPDTASAGTNAPAAAPAPVSSFLDKVLPVIDQLGAGGSLSDELAAALQADIAAADALNGASVLPPWLQALVDEATGNVTAERPRLEEALRRDPGFYPAARRLSERIISGGTAGTEAARLEQLASVEPTPALRFRDLARARLAAHNAQGAADAAAQGLLAAPGDSAFALMRAQALEELGDWYESLRILDQILNVQPDLLAAIAMKARFLYADEKNVQEATKVLDDAEARFPAEAAFPELRGQILLDTGSATEGMSSLKRALADDPGRVSTLSALLRASVDTGAWNDAASWLQQIPDASRTADDLRRGWQASEGLGAHDQAITWARALGTRGAPVEALGLEARSLLAEGKAAEALAVVNQGMAAADTPELRSMLLAIRAVSGSADPLSDLRQALLDNPENVSALAEMADLLAAQGDIRKAVEYAHGASVLDPHNAALARKAADLEARASAANP